MEDIKAAEELGIESVMAAMNEDAMAALIAPPADSVVLHTGKDYSSLQLNKPEAAAESPSIIHSVYEENAPKVDKASGQSEGSMPKHVQELLSNLPAQWTNEELADTLRTEMRITTAEGEASNAAKRKRIRELEGKPAFVIKDTQAYQAMLTVLNIIHKGEKPNVTSTFKQVLGPEQFKIALDSSYLKGLPEPGKKKLTLSEKMLKQLEWHPVVKRIFASTCPAVGRAQYMQGRNRTLRENLSSIRKMYESAVAWDGMRDQLSKHEQDIQEMRLEMAVLREQVQHVVVDKVTALTTLTSKDVPDNVVPMPARTRSTSPLTPEIRIKCVELKRLNPGMSQREAASILGISKGSVANCWAAAV